MNNLLNNCLQSSKKVYLIIVLVGLAAYAVILPTQFKTMDDLISIINNPRVHSWDQIDDIFTTSFFHGNSYYRPMVLVTFLVEHQLFGLKAFFYNLTNVLLHVTNAFLAFLILCRIMRERHLAFFCALFYVIHPVHWEAVANIPGRSIILCSTFFLAGFYYFQRMLAAERGVVWLIVSLMCYLGALLSKESAIVLPGLLAAYIWIFKRQDKAMSIINLWPYAMTAMLYLMVRRGLGINAMNFWESPSELGLGVLTFARTALTYVSQSVLPIEFYYDHTTPLYLTMTPQAWMVLGVWLVILTVILVFWRRMNPVVQFGLVWTFLNFLTVMQIIPIRAPQDRISTADHFLYLPVLGLIMILVFLAHGLLTKRVRLNPRIQTFLVGGYALYLFVTLLQQNIYATNQVAMFQRSLEHHPGNIRVRNSLAVCFAYAEKFEKAEYHYKQSLLVDPLNVDALIGAGKALADQGRYEEAYRMYQRVPHPELFETLYKDNLDQVLSALGRRSLHNY